MGRSCLLTARVIGCSRVPAPPARMMPLWKCVSAMDRLCQGETQIRDSQSEIRNPRFAIRDSQSEIRNPKHEIRNPKQIRMSQIQMSKTRAEKSFRLLAPPERTLQLHHSHSSMYVSHLDCRTNAMIARCSQSSPNVKSENTRRSRPPPRRRPRICRKTTRTRATTRTSKRQFYATLGLTHSARLAFLEGAGNSGC